MTRRKIAAQIAVYGLLLALVGGFSNAPVYHPMGPELALVRLAFSHSGQPIHECRRLSQEDLNALAPNMRKPMDCPRQRLPLKVELYLDGQTIFQAAVPATGIWGDGEATVYERFTVPAGRHRLTIEMRDSARTEGFDYRLEKQVNIRALQNLVIVFEPGLKQFVIY